MDSFKRNSECKTLVKQYETPVTWVLRLWYFVKPLHYMIRSESLVLAQAPDVSR